MNTPDMIKTLRIAAELFQEQNLKHFLSDVADRLEQTRDNGELQRELEEMKSAMEAQRLALNDCFNKREELQKRINSATFPLTISEGIFTAQPLVTTAPLYDGTGAPK